MHLIDARMDGKYLTQAMAELLTFARLTQDGGKWCPTSDPPNIPFLTICLGTILKSYCELGYYSESEMRNALEVLVFNFGMPEGPKRT